MQTVIKAPYKEEWLKILGKGMITIPKSWRDELGMKEGEIVLAKKKANQIVIEQKIKKLPYRVYTKEEIKQFLKEDRLPEKLASRLTGKFGKMTV